MAKHRAPRPPRNRWMFSCLVRLVHLVCHGWRLWKYREEIEQLFEWIASFLP
ncbi:hypothetical protein [Rhodococcus zopfii]|uniref:hypothetical protein n=1 Tax=Rhodococcus zopfii TaxID=43772 RepID=UPI001486058B|nr:hypothetical protein [Rhodococcus zopfii]